jgi:hypothetical protein
MWRRAVASAVAFRRRLRRSLWAGVMKSCHRVIGFGGRRVEEEVDRAIKIIQEREEKADPSHRSQKARAGSG